MVNKLPKECVCRNDVICNDVMCNSCMALPIPPMKLTKCVGVYSVICMLLLKKKFLTIKGEMGRYNITTYIITTIHVRMITSRTLTLVRNRGKWGGRGVMAYGNYNITTYKLHNYTITGIHCSTIHACIVGVNVI